MVGRRAGVDRALDLLTGQFRSTMQFLGDDVGRGAAEARPRSAHARRRARAEALRRGAWGACGAAWGGGRHQDHLAAAIWRVPCANAGPGTEATGQALAGRMVTGAAPAVLELRAGREGRAALVRAGGRVGSGAGGFSASSARARSTRHLELRVAADGPVVRGDQHLGVGVDAVVLDRPAELVEPGRVARDGDVGAVDQLVAVRRRCRPRRPRCGRR